MDPELEALSKVNDAIKNLPEDAKIRVVAWLINKYSIYSNQPANASMPPKKLLSENGVEEKEIVEGDGQQIASFSSPAEFFAKCSPSKPSEKILVIAAYLQTKNSEKDLSGFEINQVLKNMGHKVENITHKMDTLMGQKPQLMIQTKKSGNSRQAKKSYRVTDAGIKEVEKLILKSP